MRITLIRHAKSSWENGTLSDRRRPLNHRGQRDAPLMGSVLAEALPKPDLFLVSTAQRAQETVDLLSEAWNASHVERRNLDDLYLAGVQDWRTILEREVGSAKHVAACAHQPGIEDFATWLCRDFDDAVPTCAVISLILFNIPMEEGMADLDFYDYPRAHR